MKRWHAKVVCGVIMAIMMPICFLLPVKMVSVFRRWGSRGQFFLDLLSCFAGGVFLASYLVFMAPAVRVLIEKNLMEPNRIEYPLPDMIIGLGFFMMLGINYVVRLVNKKSSSRRSRRRSGGQPRSRYDSVRSTPDDLIFVPAASPAEPELTNGHAAPADEKGQLEDAFVTAPPTPTAAAADFRYGNKHSSLVDLATGSMSVTRSIVMMLALSIDSVLEGMTIGLKQTVVEVWAIFVGIVVHESVIAFCLGLQLVRLNDRLLPVVVASLVYTLMNPVGLAVATAVYETLESDPRVDLANGILQALTSGCFIYVIFYEILDGLVNDRTPLARIVALFVGYAFLASFAALPGSGPYHFGGHGGADVGGVESMENFSLAMTTAA